MDSNPNQSRSDRPPAAGGPGTEPRQGRFLNILAAGLLTVILLLLLARFTMPSRQGGEPEIARGEAPVNEAPSTEVPPNRNDSVKGPGASPNPAVLDTRGQMHSLASKSPLSISDHWGIEITKVSVAAGGKALDLRYKVTDVARATSLLFLTNFVYIYNQSNEKALLVPFQRENQTSQKLVAGKTYFTLLPNKEERVKSGSTVTVVVGGSRAENLVVD